LSTVYWKTREPADLEERELHKHEPARPVDEQHALPVGLYFTPDGTTEAVGVDEGNPMPVSMAGLIAAIQEPVHYAGTAKITCAAAGNYLAGDVLSASATDTAGRATYVPNLARTPGGIANFAAIRARCSEDAVLLAPRFHWFSAAPAAADVEMDDNAPFDLVTATGRGLHVGTFLGSSFVDRGTLGSTSDTVGLVEPVHCAPGETGLWLVLVTETAETNESAGMTIDLDFYVY